MMIHYTTPSHPFLKLNTSGSRFSIMISLISQQIFPIYIPFVGLVKRGLLESERLTRLQESGTLREATLFIWQAISIQFRTFDVCGTGPFRAFLHVQASFTVIFQHSEGTQPLVGRGRGPARTLQQLEQVNIEDHNNLTRLTDNGEIHFKNTFTLNEARQDNLKLELDVVTGAGVLAFHG